MHEIYQNITVHVNRKCYSGKQSLHDKLVLFINRYILVVLSLQPAHWDSSERIFCEREAQDNGKQQLSNGKLC